MHGTDEKVRIWTFQLQKETIRADEVLFLSLLTLQKDTHDTNIKNLQQLL